MSRLSHLNPRRRAHEKRRSANPVTTLVREVEKADADRTPVKVNYDRVIRANWSEPGRDAWNLAREIDDIRSRPELTADADKVFLRYLETRAIRGSEVWLSPVNLSRLAGICRRYIDPAWGAVWQKRQHDLKVASEPTYVTPESVNEAGEFQLRVFQYRR